MSTEQQQHPTLDSSNIKNSVLWAAATSWLTLPYQPFSTARRAERAVVLLLELNSAASCSQLLATRWAYTMPVTYNNRFYNAALQLQKVGIHTGYYGDPVVTEAVQLLSNLGSIKQGELTALVNDALVLTWGIANKKDFSRTADRFINENSGLPVINNHRKDLAAILEHILDIKSDVGKLLYQHTLEARIKAFKKEWL